MPQLDPSNSTCRIFTRRSGLLSVAGHDLAIEVARYSIHVEQHEAGLGVRARFDARSLHVLGALEHGRIQPDSLSARDREQIDRQIADDVLMSHRYPAVEFDSTSVEHRNDGYLVRGELQIRGVTRPLQVHARRKEAGLALECMLHQPDFGIQPFRAFGGTLRVHPDVRVQIVAPTISPDRLSDPSV